MNSNLSSLLSYSRGAKYASGGGEGFLMNFIGLLVIFYTLLIGYLLHKPSYKRYPRPEDGVLLSGGLD